MTTSVVDAQSVLAVDIGSIHTRAHLFDVVDGQYHFIAAGEVPSTVYAPYQDASEGIHRALGRLQEITGRAFVDDDAFLILPTRPDGSGVDRLVLTVSAGQDLRMVVSGLLPDVSLESAQRLAATTYSQVVESIGLNDRRRSEAQLDAIIRARPDLVILSGGTDRGATRSVLKMVDLTALACRLLPQANRPEILFAGNPVLEKRVKETLERLTTVHIAPNIRPGIDSEDLQPAQEKLAQVVGQLRARQIGGLQSLVNLTSTQPVPTSHAFGRVVRFLSKMVASNKGVLGVDLGASATTVAAALAGRLGLTVLRPFGTGSGCTQVLQQGKLEEVIQWLPLHVPDDVVRDYIWQKSLFPASLPLTGETLAIEQAVARQLLRIALQSAAACWPGLPSAYEPILASGAGLTRAVTPGQALLALLDGLQPVGVTTIYLDQNNLVPALGAAAAFNSLLPVQVIESGALMNLGTVISPISSARYGTPILRVQVDYGEGNTSQVEIKQGTLTVLPLQPGQTARLELEALRRFELDPLRKDISRGFKVTGGACGVVIDARGRPLVLPPDAPRRREMIKKWSLALA